MVKRKLLVSVAPLILILSIVAFKFYASYTAEKEVDKVVLDISSLVYIEYEKVSVGFFSTKVNIENVVLLSLLDKQTTKIDKIILGDFQKYQDESMPTYIKLIGIDSGAFENPLVKKRLSELEYQKVKFNLSIDYNYDQEEGELDIKEMSLASDQVGALNLRLKVNNLDLQPESIMSLPMTYTQTNIEKIELEYKDHSLVERLYKLQAASNNETVAEYKKNLADNAEKYVNDGNDKFIIDIVSNIKKFIERPNSIAIRIAPKKPISLQSIIHIGDPKEIIRLLNIEVES